MKKYISLVVIAAMVLLSACTHKELCDLHEHTVKIVVQFDWQDAPEADPAGMCVFFYNEDKGTMQRFDFSGMNGGEIDLLQDATYKIITYNNDTESVLFANTNSWDNHLGYTREGSVFEGLYAGTSSTSSIRALGAESENVLITPDMMWGYSVTDVYVEPEVDYQVITLYPHPLVCHYTLTVKNVENISYLQQVCGTLSGMAPQLTFSSEELGEECVTIPYYAEGNTSAKTITADFYTWGHNINNSNVHSVVLYVWMQDGNKYYFTTTSASDDYSNFDVTSQVENAADPYNVDLVIDALKLPTNLGNGDGSFDIGVDDWYEIEYEIVANVDTDK